MKKPKPENKTESTELGNPAAAAPGETPEDGIGDRIRSAREARGLSQTALATRTRMADSAGKGVARTVLVGYEAGTFRPGAREMRLICQALSVSPNWLLLGDEVPPAQASMEAVRGRDWTSALRLAMAITILKTHERAALKSLVLSLAGRQLGDMKLSALLAAGSMIAEASAPQLKEWLGGEADEVLESLDSLVLKHCVEGFSTNWGNKLLLDEDEGDVVGGEWLYKDPGEVA